jgi:hypothetical protein
MYRSGGLVIYILIPHIFPGSYADPRRNKCENITFPRHFFSDSRRAEDSDHIASRWNRYRSREAKRETA